MLEREHWPTTVSVAMIVTDPSFRRILLVRKKGYDELWGLPAGRLEKNESPEIAAIRELQEETGLTLAEMKRPRLSCPRIVTEVGPEKTSVGVVYIVILKNNPPNNSWVVDNPEIACCTMHSHHECAELIQAGKLYKPNLNVPALNIAANWCIDF